MSKILGSIIKLTINGIELAAQVTGSLGMESDFFLATHKDSTTRAKGYLPRSTTWRISIEGLYDPAATMGVSEAIDYLKAGTKVTINYGGIAPGEVFYTGYAFIYDIQMQGAKDELASYAIELQGTGPISESTLGLELYGFGSDSEFAYTQSPTTEPKIMVVDRLTSSISDGAADTTSGNNIDYRGSLAYCLAQSFPRIILFEVSGTIDMRNNNYLYLVNTIGSAVGFCWVVGQSAPSPGIDIIGTTLWIASVTDVLFQHVTIGLGDINMVAGADDRDAVTIHGTYLTTKQIFFNRCTLKWCTDDIIDSKAHNFNLSKCLIYEPLGRHERAEKGNTYHIPIGVWEGTTAAFRNIFAFSYDRDPWCWPSQSNSSNQYAVINNLFFNAYRPGPMFGWDVGSSLYIEVAMVGNWVYRFKTEAAASAWEEFCGLLRAAQSTSANSKYYLSDNKSKAKDDGASDWTSIYGSSYHSAGNESESPFDISDFPIISAENVPAALIAEAGSKWRDQHDRRILTEVEDAILDDRDYRDSPQAIPARAVNWHDSNGDVSSGFDYSTTPQGFTVAVNGGTPTAVTLNTNCANHAAVIAHINTRIAAAGLSGVEAYHPGEVNTPDRWVGLRTILKGSTASLVITSSTATSIDLQNGTYNGQDSVSSGYLTRANNSHVLSVPDNPNTITEGLRNIERWIFNTFAEDPVEINGSATNPNLVTNGGGDDTTDWTDSNADGVADNWSVIGTGANTPSITTGGGFTGNAQRLLFTDTTGYAALSFSLTGLTIGKTYDFDAKGRGNTNIRVMMDGATLIATITATTGTPNSAAGTFVATATSHLLRFYFTPTTPATNDWMELDEVNFREQ